MVLLLFSTFLGLSSNNMFGIWAGMEMNLIIFVTLICSNSTYKSEVSIIYFLFQSLAGLLFLYFVFSICIINIYFDLTLLFIQLIVLMKIGAAPFHYWIPMIMKYMTWFDNFILMTWQKLIPLILVSYFTKIKSISFVLIISAMVGSIGGLNQTSLNKLIAYSSINQISWMILSILLSNFIFKVYFLIYSFILIGLCFMFSWLNIMNLIQLFSMNFKFSMLKLMLFLNLLSLAGLPPFIGFFSKLLVIKEIIWTILPGVILLLLILSLFVLMYYLYVMYSCTLLNASNLWGVKDITTSYFLVIMFNFFSNVLLLLMFWMIV